MNANCLHLLITLAAFTVFTSRPALAQQESTPATAPSEQTTTSPAEESVPAPVSVPVPTPQITITDIKIGAGREAVDGDTVTVHYTGWLYDAKAPKNHGKKFDSSLDRARPITFTLGAHRVIQGWEQGLPGMKVGGKRNLFIPSELAYGARGASGVIPPNATLIFDVELISVKSSE